MNIMLLMYVPSFLVAMRFAIAPLLLFDTLDHSISNWLAIAFCLINTIEEIAMTLILPKWTHDILSIFHALDLRNAWGAESHGDNHKAL